MFPLIAIAHNNSIRFLRLQPELAVVKRRYAGDKEKMGEEQYQLFKKARYNPLVGVVPLLLQLIIVMGVMQVLLNPPSVNMRFLALELDALPSITNPSLALFVPLLSGLVATVFCLVQNALSPATLSQSKAVNSGMTIFIVVLSVYLGLMLPIGVGVYWITGNLLSIVIVLILNILYNPKKLAPEAMKYIEANRKAPQELREERTLNKQLRKREKEDATRFIATKKHLVFYAISGGQYKYYKKIIEYLLDNTELAIHYLTNDPNDSIFKQKNSKLIPYYAGQRKTISLMMKLDTDIFVTTVPDLQSLHIKRSIVRNDIDYIYVFHGLASVHLVVRERAFDHYDTIFCVGPHQVAELRRREELANLPRRTLVKAGYGAYDQLVESYAAISHITNEKPRILIAPSWQVDNIMDICIDEILEAVVGRGYDIVVRPHPQYIDMFPERIKSLTERYFQYTNNGELTFELDFSDNTSIFLSDILITDWSTIAYEFSYCTLKPSIFINTPMKIMNPNYEQYGLEVLDITLRDKVGVSVDIEDIEALDNVMLKLLDEKESYRSKIKQIVEQYIYHPGRNGEAGGKHIINQLMARGITS